MTDTQRAPTNRRGFLRKVAGTAALGASGVAFGSRAEAAKRAKGSFEGDPFTLGVASGDPLPDSVVLWTRLAPEPLEPGGGAPDRPVPVLWEVAADEEMRDVVRRGVAFARPDWAHSVHVDVDGLDQNTTYYYQFQAGSERSPVGETKTAPAPDTSIDSFSFAFASCQSWSSGYYTAYDHMVEDDLDLVVHLGDYVYEYPISPSAGERSRSVPSRFNAEMVTLEQYRLRHALYKTDPDLQAAHAAFPWLVTWDDHEVENNYADEVSENGVPPENFLDRRANAYKAYFEHMPIRPSRTPTGPDLRLYRNFTFGDLAEFNVLDTRQYRSDQACGDGVEERCEERFDDARTILGDAQEDWLTDNLAASDATWNVLANQVFFSRLDLDAGKQDGEKDPDVGEDDAFSMDKWDGYVADRDRLVDAMRDDRVTNPVVITGDIHSNWQADIKADFDDPASKTVGTEFVGTSISSFGNGSDTTREGRSAVADNPHVGYFNDQRGYVRCEITPEEWRTDYRVLDYVTSPGSPIRTDASFAVKEGDPGARRL